MLKPLSGALIIFLLGMAELAAAGELRLDNGAVLPGELDSIGAITLVWSADKIGKLTVAKSDVLSLRTNVKTTVEMAAHKAAQPGCLVSVQSSQWSLDCDEHPQSVAFAPLRSLPPEHSSTGRFTTSIDIDRGTNPSEEYKVDLTARWLRPQRRHNVFISVDYETSDGDTTDDDADANYQYDILRDNGWYWFGRLRYYRDMFSALEEIYAVGGGLGREFSPVNNVTLSLQGGPAQMYYTLEDQDFENEPGASVRWTMLWHTPWRGITASHSADLGWIPSIDDAYLLQSKTALTFPIYQGLIAEIRLEYDKSGVTIGSNGDQDTEWVFALGYQW